MATPTTISSVVSRLWNKSFITQERILQDHDRIWKKTLPAVLAVGGAMIPHCGDRRGKRRDTATKFGGWGGNRKKGKFTRPKNVVLHPHAAYGLQMLSAKSHERYISNGAVTVDEPDVCIRMADDDGLEVFFDEDIEEA